MKYFLTLIAIQFLSLGLSAQDINQGGKTYYDAEQKIVKEIFQYKAMFNVRVDPKTHERVIDETPVAIKHGQYLMYSPKGILMVTGNYEDDRKSGNWKFYNEKGVLVKQENYKSDRLVN